MLFVNIIVNITDKVLICIHCTVFWNLCLALCRLLCLVSLSLSVLIHEYLVSNYGLSYRTAVLSLQQH